MEKINYSTHISITGEKAHAFAGINAQASPEVSNEIVVAAFSSEEAHVSLGIREIRFGYVVETDNREVVVFGGKLDKKKRGRKVSVDEDGFGKQQVTTGVDLIVRTDAPIEVFKANPR